MFTIIVIFLLLPLSFATSVVVHIRIVPRFSEEETEVMEITQGQKGSKWQRWNLSPDSLVTESVF